jgi:GNAT superfamily N-acetyltransferase
VSELDRILEFVCGIGDRAAGEKEPSAFGIAHLHDELPDVWSRNYLLATTNLDEADATSLALEADRILGPRGLRHRKIEMIDDAAGERLEPGFRELGWLAQCDVIMVSRREPDRAPGTPAAEEVALDELIPAWEEGWRAEPRVENEGVVKQLVDNRRVIAELIDTRFFAVRLEGEVAGYCELYSDGRTAQIENVFTLQRFRRRGVARATVSRALEEARRGGNDLVFLLADRDDWPQQLYAKLGFDTIGRMWEFIRPGQGTVGEDSDL